MKLYAACLASYNNGVLHGRWIDASSDVDAMQEEVSAMLRESRFPNVTVIATNGYEQAALNAGWTRNAHNGMFVAPIGSETRMADYDDWKELCESNGIAPETVPSAEEWAIHDYEDLPSSFGEYSGLKAIADYVELTEEFDHIEAGDMLAIYDDFRDVNEAREALEDRFSGIHATFRDYADEFADESIAAHSSDGRTPQFLINYFDYAAFARDLSMEMHTIDVPSGVAVFHA